MVKERPQQVLAEVLRRIAAETDLSNGAAVETLLVMKPGADDQINVRGIGLLGFECLVQRDIAVDVFLIPEAMDEHRWYGDVLLGQDLVQGLVLPEFIVGRMAHQLGREAYLLKTVTPRHLAGRADTKPGVVIIVVVRPPGNIAAAG